VSYEFIAQLSQITTLVMFIALFVVVVGYAFWPSNRRRFDAIQSQALDLGANGQDLSRQDLGRRS
jgi:cbb3-type cytochrome oxidase subunit 3